MLAQKKKQWIKGVLKKNTIPQEKNEIKRGVGNKFKKKYMFLYILFVQTSS
jgi:hypothetical protein